jgi:hypothetical protein
MECAIAIVFLKGRDDELVAKEVDVISKNIIQTYHFMSPYTQYFSDDYANGLSWDDGFINYDKHFTVLSEVISNFAHVYAYGASTCQFIKDLLHIPVHDLQTLNCPDPNNLNSDFRCYMTCHKNFYDVRCAVRHAHALYNRLEYHIKTKQYVRCPKDMTGHTAMFSSAIKQN